MRKETYLKITETVRRHPERIRALVSVNQVLTGSVFLAYPGFLIWLILQKNLFVFRAVFVPMISFLGVTVFRKILNVPRPYERFETEPAIPKDKKGQSFPSRHVFSAYIIAVTVFCVYPSGGILLGLIGAGMAVIRVFGGVHTPCDVTAGALIGIICGVFGYYVL